MCEVQQCWKSIADIASLEMHREKVMKIASHARQSGNSKLRPLQMPSKSCLSSCCCFVSAAMEASNIALLLAGRGFGLVIVFFAGTLHAVLHQARAALDADTIATEVGEGVAGGEEPPWSR